MYGRPGEMPQYCSAHKAEDMVDVKKRRRCNADGCERRASYALEGEKAAFCSAHKQPGHVNVNNRRCVTYSRNPFTCLYCDCFRDAMKASWIFWSKHFMSTSECIWMMPRAVQPVAAARFGFCIVFSVLSNDIDERDCARWNDETV